MDQIKNYIQESRQHGQSDAAIKEALLNAGWDVSAVDQAFSTDILEPAQSVQYSSPSNTERIQSGNISLLNQTNVPKKWSEFNQLKSLLFGLGLMLTSLILGPYIYSKDNHQAGILVGLISFIFGLVLTISSWISYRQLRSSELRPKTQVQFQTSTATEYSIPNEKFQSATSGETITNWIGPVIRADKGAVSHSILSKEVLKQAENTLLFTPTQIIAIMLTPADTQNIQKGALGNAASAYINYSSDTAADKNQEFRVLHSRKWEQLVDNIKSQPLQNVIQNHISYSIPYNNIQSFKIKNSLINPGYIFNLSDGSDLRFGLYRKDKMNEITDFLKQYIQFKE